MPVWCGRLNIRRFGKCASSLPCHTSYYHHDITEILLLSCKTNRADLAHNCESNGSHLAKAFVKSSGAAFAAVLQPVLFAKCAWNYYAVTQPRSHHHQGTIQILMVYGAEIKWEGEGGGRAEFWFLVSRGCGCLPPHLHHYSLLTLSFLQFLTIPSPTKPTTPSPSTNHPPPTH